MAKSAMKQRLIFFDLKPPESTRNATRLFKSRPSSSTSSWRCWRRLKPRSGSTFAERIPKVSARITIIPASGPKRLVSPRRLLKTSPHSSGGMRVSTHSPARGKSYRIAQLVAHNAAFDGPFLTNWFEKLDIYLPARRLMLCTMQLAMWQFMDNVSSAPKNFQLANLCEHFGVPFHAAAAHEALGDATATVRLFQAIVRRGQDKPQVAA